MAAFFDRLEARARSINSLLCVGLDPHAVDLEAQTSEAVVSFCKRLIESTSDVAAAYKPNIAFFEALGAPGYEALAQVIEFIPDEIPVLLDAKRGDIGSTAAAYAKATFETFGADAVTVNPYMGSDTLTPFISDSTRGVFVLCKTSNPASSELQTLTVAGGSDAVFERVADLANKLNTGNNIGVVVGATDIDALRRVRQRHSELWILAPGVGAQGGDLAEALEASLSPSGFGILLPVSRGISRAADPRQAAQELVANINSVRQEVQAARDAAAASASAEDVAVAVEDGESKEAAASMTALAQLGDACSASDDAQTFLALSLRCRVLRFGTFTLKSGRESPYFFNAGHFHSGSALAALGGLYARAIARSGLQFDALFGPAYKGIMLVAAVASALYSLSGGALDVPVAYNRKEAKDHGEGGKLVGAPLAGQRVLIIDDVITAGTAVREAIALLGASGAEAVGVAVGLDRQERTNDEGSTVSAVQKLQTEAGLTVVSIAGLSDLLQFAAEGESAGEAAQALRDAAPRIAAYRETYGVQQ